MRPVSIACRVGEQSAVVWKRLYFNPFAASRSATGVAHGPPNALDHYEDVLGEKIPDKLPLPLEVHRRQGEPCPRCGTTLEAIHFKDYVMSYCPQEQTGGRVLKDRRLSRLLK